MNKSNLKFVLSLLTFILLVQNVYASVGSFLFCKSVMKSGINICDIEKYDRNQEYIMQNLEKGVKM